MLNLSKSLKWLSKLHTFFTKEQGMDIEAESQKASQDDDFDNIETLINESKIENDKKNDKINKHFSQFKTIIKEGLGI